MSSSFALCILRLHGAGRVDVMITNAPAFTCLGSRYLYLWHAAQIISPVRSLLLELCELPYWCGSLRFLVLSSLCMTTTRFSIVVHVVMITVAPVYMLVYDGAKIRPSYYISSHRTSSFVVIMMTR